MPGLNPTEQDYNSFIEITGADRSAAQHFLENGTTVEGAIEDFFASNEAGGEPAELDELDELDAEDDLMEDEEQPSQPQQPVAPAGGARTLGGQAADTDLPAGWGKKEKKTGRVGEWSSGGSSRRPGEIATLSNTGDQAGQPDDDDSEDEDPRRKGEKELYIGGEKSGLAVENPDRAKKGPKGIVEEILKQASQASRNAAEPKEPKSSFFGGSGNTLGSEDTPAAPPAAPQVSAVTPSMFDSILGGLMGRGAAPPPEEEEEEEVQTRQLIFWRNGFSIEDGPLMEYEAPGNPELLRAIQSGRAPPSLFGVRYNQPLQVEVAQRTGEDYVQQPKKKVSGFAGGGNRLGSVTPDVPAPVPGALPAAGSGGGMVSQGASTGNVPEFQVDGTLPTTSVQLRLADGSKLVAKVNLTHTVRDLRNFIMGASVASNQRPFILQTTFPSKELSDEKQTIEQAGLKNAVVVQRFT